MYVCSFISDMMEDSYFPTYTMAKKYAEELGEWCMLISPNGIHISAYIEGEWMTIH